MAAFLDSHFALVNLKQKYLGIPSKCNQLLLNYPFCLMLSQ